MEDKLAQIMNILESAKQQVEIKSQTDHSYVTGKIDGWKEAINYFTGIINEVMKEGIENDIEKK